MHLPCFPAWFRQDAVETAFLFLAFHAIIAHQSQRGVMQFPKHCSAMHLAGRGLTAAAKGDGVLWGRSETHQEAAKAAPLTEWLPSHVRLRKADM